MDHQTFSWVHPEFNIGDAGDCSFCGIAGADGLSYLILGKDRTLRALQAWDFSGTGGDASRIFSAIRTILATDTFYALPFAWRRCAVSTPHTTLVTKRFFRPDTLPSYLQLLLPDGDYHYGATELPLEDIRAVYALDQELYGLIEQFAQNSPLHHLSAGQIAAYQQVHEQQKAGVFAHVRGYSLQISVLDRRHLVFFNAFRFDSPGDFLYYVLLAYEQCRLKPDAVPLFLSGNILDNGAIYRNLVRYVQSIHFLNWTGTVIPDTAAALPNKHLFFDLFAAASETSSVNY
jgi:hypothetical protein